MATMSIRLSDEDKKQAEILFKELGLTANAAINMFIKQCLRTQSLPFTPSLDVPNKRLMDALEESERIMDEIKTGKRKGYTDTENLFGALDSDI